MAAWASPIFSACTTGSSGSATTARYSARRNAAARKRRSYRDGPCMPDIDIEPTRAQRGRTVPDAHLATAAPLRGMVVTFDRDERAPVEGEDVPPGWHLAYFPEASRLSGLGADGLPLERGVLPKMPLPRRMYAGAT